MKNYNTHLTKNLINSAKTALITVPEVNIDSVGSALALALALQKKGIEVKVYSPQKTDANYSKLNGLSLLTDNYNLNDLTVSLNYPLDQIENVSYNDDGGRLNLIVKTKSGAPQIQNDSIIISNQSVSDISFMIGDETKLGANSVMTQKGNWINISPINVAKDWAKASIIDPDAPFSEIFSFLIPELGLELSSEVAKNLLISLRVATQSFSINVSPETFEAGAVCLRATQQASETPVVNTTPIEEVETKPSSVPMN